MKSTRKVSPIKYREVLSTIERICVASNPNEDNEALNDIYTFSHAFVGTCDNLHEDWRERQEKVRKELDEARI